MTEPFEDLGLRHAAGGPLTARAFVGQSLQQGISGGRDPLQSAEEDDLPAERRAKIKGQWIEHVSRSVVWERDRGICYLCGFPADPARWDLEHVHPIDAGGEHSYLNTAVSHPSCNRSKGAKPWPNVGFTA